MQAKNGAFRETEIWEVPTGLLNQVCCSSYDDYFACFEFKYTLITYSHMGTMHYGKFCRMCVVWMVDYSCRVRVLDSEMMIQ